MANTYNQYNTHLYTKHTIEYFVQWKPFRIQMIKLLDDHVNLHIWQIIIHRNNWWLENLLTKNQYQNPYQLSRIPKPDLKLSSNTTANNQ